MKKHRSNKPYYFLILWVDQILAFNFNIERIPIVKMGLFDYISRQPNQGAKVTYKCRKELAVATITRICGLIVAII